MAVRMSSSCEFWHAENVIILNYIIKAYINKADSYSTLHYTRAPKLCKGVRIQSLRRQK